MKVTSATRPKLFFHTAVFSLTLFCKTQELTDGLKFH